MSVGDHEIEEPDEYAHILWCSIHLTDGPCPHCKDESADRQHQDSIDRDPYDHST